MPSIDRTSGVPFYQQVYEQIAQGIESGLYPAGKKLPSIRECARDLGVSNTTIELAYQRLTEEGYVQARRGSGFSICELATTPTSKMERFSQEYRNHQEALVADEETRRSAHPAVYDFAYDSVDASIFPCTVWARICREVFFEEGADQACLYNDPQGLRDLRDQIANYLNSEYGLACLPEQILIMPRTRDLVAEIIALFDPSETVVALENPGYDEVRKRLEKTGYSIRPFPVFPYPAWEEAEKTLRDVNLVFTTPVSQFPSNHLMPEDLRRSLVAWASETGAYVIDDEYGWEFQAGLARTPSLAAIDAVGRVITIGTFSNSFTPAACLSYAVLPPQLMLRWRKRSNGSHPPVPWQTQAAMASFMKEGLWRTHVRKIRTAMHKKKSVLIQALNEHLGDTFDIVEGQNSLFVLLMARDGRSEEQLVEEAARLNARVYPTSQYWDGEAPADWRYVLVGYAGIPIDSIEDGVKALAQAWLDEA